MKFVVIVINRYYHFLIASCGLHLSNWMDITFLINVNHPREGMSSSVVSNWLQLLAISSFVNFHYIFSILVWNLLHLLVLISPITKHIHTTATTILLLRLLQFFVHWIPYIFLVTPEVTFSFIIVIVQFFVYFRSTKPGVSSRAILEVTKHTSLRVCVGIVASKLNVSFITCLVYSLLAVYCWKWNIRFFIGKQKDWDCPLLFVLVKARPLFNLENVRLFKNIC